MATLNNQKAFLKVGTDNYFVTGISGGGGGDNNDNNNDNNNSNTSNNAGNNVQMPTLILTPFFSGIALDVTPQINDANMITPRIHPSVTTVTEKVKQIDRGTVGNYRLPLASSSVNETDTVVRCRKCELVVLIKPSIIRTAGDWAQHNRAAAAALDDLEGQSRRVISVNGEAPAVKVAP